MFGEVWCVGGRIRPEWNLCRHSSVGAWRCISAFDSAIFLAFLLPFGLFSFFSFFFFFSGYHPPRVSAHTAPNRQYHFGGEEGGGPP